MTSHRQRPSTIQRKASTFEKSRTNTTTRTRKLSVICCKFQMLSTRQKRNEHSACRPVPDQRNNGLAEAEGAEAEAATEVIVEVDAAGVADGVTAVTEDAGVGAGDDFQYRLRLKSHMRLRIPLRQNVRPNDLVWRSSRN